jgi:hypothetical protein
MPRLVQSMDDLSRPFIIFGREYVANTPDTSTGAYYDYDLDRALILLEVDRRVHAGLERFGKVFKKILESPRLPPAPKLAAALAPINSLSPKQLKQKMEIYRGVLVSRYADQVTSKSSMPFKLLGDPNYWNNLKKEEMRSALVVEKMKQTIGVGDSPRVSRLLDFKH